MNPLAQPSSASLGRLFPESTHSFRNCFQRDRDRIVHSTAFRHLDGKTQVFLNGKGDYYRTRLTHTIEVASISRTIARALDLNEDLAEAIALAHDLGHSPSGHAGETTLHNLMQDHGGFDHNEQSLRVVTLLEESYPQHPGLNLSYEVLEGLRKHHHSFTTPDGTIYPSPTLEAQLVDTADEIAYSCHDIDDGMEAGLLSSSELETLSLWQAATEQAKKELSETSNKITINRRFVLRCLINRQVEELISASKEAIHKAGVSSLMEVRMHSKNLITFSSSYIKEITELRRFLFKHFYRHPKIAFANEEACAQIETIFNNCIQNPKKYLSDRFYNRLKNETTHRVVCDYIAGMTDRYVRQWKSNPF